MTLARHVYSPHIDVASLQWWNGLETATQQLPREAMCEAARYQRRDNRDKDAARLELLERRGMRIEKNPDLAAFRAKVADMKDMDLYQDPKVQTMLQKILAAVR